MKIAIISDIHANLEALKTVLDDISAQKAETIYCLGDVIGFGPNPIECLELIREKARFCLCGNHEDAYLYNGDIAADKWFYPSASTSIYWTRSKIQEADGNSEQPKFNYIAGQRHAFIVERHHKDNWVRQEGQISYCHASPRNSLSERIASSDIANESKMSNLFSAVPKYCFHGHTHVPGIISEDRKYWSPEDTNNVYELGDQKLFINVGSVGQPRDGDPRASYVILDGNTVIFRRLAYPCNITRNKILEIPDLDPRLGDSLCGGESPPKDVRPPS